MLKKSNAAPKKNAAPVCGRALLQEINPIFAGDTINKESVAKLDALYAPIKGEIESRLGEFRTTWKNGCEDDIFAELAFCLLTPQSKARVCWSAIEGLRAKKMLCNSAAMDICRELRGVRFHNNKARYIEKARKVFTNSGRLVVKPKIASFHNAVEAREWLVGNVLGMGYKEASHFLRNIGFGGNLAILDRHILKNLKYFGVIDDVPRSLAKKTYLETEEKMRRFAKTIKIPLSHLDLLLWYKEAGEIFK